MIKKEELSINQPEVLHDELFDTPRVKYLEGTLLCGHCGGAIETVSSTNTSKRSGTRCIQCNGLLCEDGQLENLLSSTN